VCALAIAPASPKAPTVGASISAIHGGQKRIEIYKYDYVFISLRLTFHITIK